MYVEFNCVYVAKQVWYNKFYTKVEVLYIAMLLI
jgi:hypothetical protein